MSKRRRETTLPAPFLKRLFARETAGERPDGYPFTIGWLADPEFELHFEQPVTILVGENGSGKSTLLEALAKIAGFDAAGGGKGHSPVNHSAAIESGGAELAPFLRAAWLPKVTAGWFFRAESFFSVARYLDAVGSPSANFLSHSHGEGFLRLFDERTSRQGFYLLDEPESALSPRRQLELLRHLTEVQETARAQVVVATHSPLLMGVPGAALLEVTRGGLSPTHLENTAHFRLLRAFCEDPMGFVASAIAGDEDLLF